MSRVSAFLVMAKARRQWLCAGRVQKLKIDWQQKIGGLLFGRAEPPRR
jgi:hypothetical protein